MKKIFFLLLISSPLIFSQQISDPDFNPDIQMPAYEKGKGSTVLIDEGHHNFHTMTGRYKPFANLLLRDGYVVKPNEGKFTEGSLMGAKILVISNALNEKNETDWVLPTPSAFAEDEINAVVEWVKKGGSLFLIADHMPFPGAAGELAERFGFNLINGFALDTTKGGQPDLFTQKDKTLGDNEITKSGSEGSVDSIYSFTGEGFKIPGDAEPVLILNENFVAFMPDTAWNFKDDTKKIPLKGYSQGAVKKFETGKVAVWGEAAMFSAQLSNGNKIGMNSPSAKNNYKLLLSIIHWLDNKKTSP